VDACILHGAPLDVEAQVHGPGGGIVWVRLMVDAEKDSSGRVQRIYGAVQDITAQKRVELELKETQRAMSSLLANLPGTRRITLPDNHNVAPIARVTPLITSEEIMCGGTICMLQPIYCWPTVRISVQSLAADMWVRFELQPTNRRIDCSSIRGQCMDQAERKELEDQLRKASARERELWEQVKGKYPGQDDHDPVRWGEWMEAAQLVRDLARRLRG
jgi:hypothetical protein